MNRNTPHIQDVQVRDAITCLEEHDEEIEFIANSWRGDYQTARTFMLAKYLRLTEAEAQAILEQVDNKAKESARKIQEVRSSVNALQKDPYDTLVEQLIYAYKLFLQDHNLAIGAQIPERFLDTPILEFSTFQWKKQSVFLALAHLLLNPRINMDCREFFISAVAGVRRI